MTNEHTNRNGRCYIFHHPLIKHKLTEMRQEHLPSSAFRSMLSDISRLMIYEVTSDIRLVPFEVKTPLTHHLGEQVAESICLVPVLRAGLGMLDSIFEMLPMAQVGHIGLARNEQTFEPHEYYVKLPPMKENTRVMLLDPMLATGGSANAAIQVLKNHGARFIQLISLLAVKEGIDAVQLAHPDVDIYVAAVDPVLNDHGYIVPGLGDAGDRLFNL